MLDCEQRKSSIPNFPIYPNATVVDRKLPTDWENPASAIFVYETLDTPEQVAEFFSGKTYCTFYAPPLAETVCHGDAAPFGIPCIYRPFRKQVTSYWIDVSWDRCGDVID
jgi:hypothetical protein